VRQKKKERYYIRTFHLEVVGNCLRVPNICWPSEEPSDVLFWQQAKSPMFTAQLSGRVYQALFTLRVKLCLTILVHHIKSGQFIIENVLCYYM